MFRRPMAHEQLAQHMQHILAVELTIYVDGQAFTAELINHREHPEGLAVVRAVPDEVLRPDMVLVGWAQPDA